MKKLFISLLFCSAVGAMDKTLVKSELPLCKDNAWLVHRTRVFPRDGVLVPGSLSRITKTHNDTQRMEFVGEESTPLADIYRQAQLGITAVRMTLHWSLNSLVYPHEMEMQLIGGNKCTFDDGRESFPYIVIEHISAFNNKRLSGYWQDTCHLGAHRLNDQAIILVPENDKEYEEYVGSFAGTVIRYMRGKAREAVEAILKQKKAPLLYPCMKGLEAAKFQWYLSTNGRYQKVVVQEKDYLCEEISACLGLDNISPGNSTIMLVQDKLLNLTRSIRTVLTLEYAKSSILGSIDKKDVCVVCKKSTERIQKKILLQCAQCQSVIYCSCECQKAHWPKHKMVCNDLRSFNDANAQAYKEYRMYLSRSGSDPYKCTLEVFARELGDLLKTYKKDRERQIIKSYQMFIGILLDYLYSPEQKYVQLREKYKVHELNGFINYCYMIRDTIAPLAKEWEGHFITKKM